MAGKRAAQRYAKALLSLAKNDGSLEAIDADIRFIDQTLAGSKDLRLMLKSPVIKDTLKLSSLKAIFKDVDAQTMRLFDVLKDNKRISLLPLIAEQFTVLVDADNKISDALVTTAVPLTLEMEEKVLAKVKALTGQEARLTKKVDDKLIGGFLLRIGDLQYDASILGKLNKLRHNFNQNA